MRAELVKLGGIYSVTPERQIGTVNFISWDRLDRELLSAQYPSEYITGISVSDRGLEIHLERKPIAHTEP